MTDYDHSEYVGFHRVVVASSGTASDYVSARSSADDWRSTQSAHDAVAEPEQKADTNEMDTTEAGEAEEKADTNEMDTTEAEAAGEAEEKSDTNEMDTTEAEEDANSSSATEDEELFLLRATEDPDHVDYSRRFPHVVGEIESRIERDVEAAAAPAEKKKKKRGCRADCEEVWDSISSVISRFLRSFGKSDDAATI